MSAAPRPVRATRSGALLTAALVLVVLPTLACPAGAGEGADALAEAVERARLLPHSGEVIAVTWIDGVERVAMSEVAQGFGTTTVAATGRRLELSTWGGGLADPEQGWYQDLVMTGGPSTPRGDLEANYDVAITGTGMVLNRDTVQLEVRRRSDGQLRERFEIDQRSGLVLRRESWDGERRWRMATYSRLDLRPDDVDATPVTLAEGLTRRGGEASRVGSDRIDALREGGWVVPDVLPGGFASAGVWAGSDDEQAHLQQVFDDGLYSVSLFSQRGRLDWDALPPGSEPLEGLGERAVAWPGAAPGRIVWEAGGTTFTLVGDAPAADLRALAAAVPAPEYEEAGFWRRLGAGLGRIWEWLT